MKNIGIKDIWGVFLFLLAISLTFIIPTISLSINKPVDVPFLADTDAKNALVFFGFPGCGDICPTSLLTLRDVSFATSANHISLAVVFVDIDRNSSSAQADNYAKQFHPEFIGVKPSSTEMQQFNADFGLNFQQVGDKIEHRGRTYLLRKLEQQWYLVKSYNPGQFDSEMIEKELL
ncbi:MAG: SCO family protein [Reinekea sp.]|jgi:protein SCO1